jgi:hypothetical protein
MKLSDYALERYLVDLANSYAEESDYMRTRLERGYASGVRETVNHVLALLNGEVSVIYTDKEISA